MKKILAMVLALCLMCGGAALADNTTINQDTQNKTANTTISYTISAGENYIVTIPSSLTLTNSGDKLSGTIAIRLDASGFNVSGKTIAVKLSEAAFKLVNGEKEIPYNIKAAGVEYKSGDTVLSWTYGEATDTTRALVVQSTSGLSNLPAGEYKDTLTFAVSVSENSAGIGNVTVGGWGDGGTISGEATED